MSEFVIDKIISIDVVRTKCHICGYDSKNHSLHSCSACGTNLVAETFNYDEPFCLIASLGEG
jgi:hypothetical protein